MNDKEKELWVQYGQLQAQREKKLEELQVINQAMQQTKADVAVEQAAEKKEVKKEKAK